MEVPAQHGAPIGAPLRAVAGRLALCLCLASGCADEPRADMRRVIDAVEAYQALHGEPPASLAMLVPEHLRSIPRTEQGLRYERKVGGGWSLIHGNSGCLAGCLVDQSGEGSWFLLCTF